MKKLLTTLILSTLTCGLAFAECDPEAAALKTVKAGLAQMPAPTVGHDFRTSLLGSDNENLSQVIVVFTYEREARFEIPAGVGQMYALVTVDNESCKIEGYELKD